MEKWHNSVDCVVALGGWLDEQGEFPTTERMQYFYANPWKWENEWHSFIKCRALCEGGKPVDVADIRSAVTWDHKHARISFGGFSEREWHDGSQEQVENARESLVIDCVMWLRERGVKVSEVDQEVTA